MKILKSILGVLAPISLIVTPIAAWGGEAAAPIPEPNIITLFALAGVGGLLFYRTKRK